MISTGNHTCGSEWIIHKLIVKFILRQTAHPSPTFICEIKNFERFVRASYRKYLSLRTRCLIKYLLYFIFQIIYLSIAKISHLIQFISSTVNRQNKVVLNKRWFTVYCHSLTFIFPKAYSCFHHLINKWASPMILAVIFSYNATCLWQCHSTYITCNKFNYDVMIELWSPTCSCNVTVWSKQYQFAQDM